jgi:FtsP/CotA-like multicopper oxidase with cupredoxin domain
VLRASLSFRNYQAGDGRARYCYIAGDGSQSPTLRLNPGDLLILTLKNEISLAAGGMMKHPAAQSSSCSSGIRMMDASSTNLHFHGLAIPPKCYQDETVTTLVSPSAPFEYRFRVPPDAPPGLYWYHPHVHGFSEEQVLGGASGALIVEGIERANKPVAGLPERILVVRDQKISSEKPDPNRPGKDLSVNFVPILYPIPSRPLSRCGHRSGILACSQRLGRYLSRPQDRIQQCAAIYGSGRARWRPCWLRRRQRS